MFRKRRQLVFGALGVSALTAAAAAWRYWPEHGFANPCRARLPDKLAHHEIVRVIEPPLAPVLAAIREHNPLLFDFALKRHLRAGGKGFPARVFETQPFFAR